MNTKRIHYLLSALLLTLRLSPLCAQFNNGIFLDAGQEKAQLSGRTWHISSKINANEPLLVGFDDDLYASGSTTQLSSHFIIEPAADDGKWWTSDARWFYIRSVNTGLYVTIANINAAVDLAAQYTGTNAYKQQFRAVPSATAGWYKLRSRLSDAGEGYVLEVGNGASLYAAAPHADPSSEQKFAFNLALPEQAAAKYAIVGINNSDYFSDNGIHAAGTPAVHVKTANASTIWNILPEADGKYSIFNALTQQYLSVASGSDLNDEVIMAGNEGDRSRWEMIRDGHTFKFKNVSSGRFVGTLAQTADGRSLREVGPLGIGIRWVVYRIMQLPVAANPGNFQRIADAPAQTDCFYNFGGQFKRAVAERAGFPADPAYFPIVLAAVADSVQAGQAEETLAKFAFNSRGHRVNLALLVRQYVLKNIAVRPRSSWTAGEEQAVAWFEQKIHELRVDYANRVTTAWDDYRSGKNAVNTWGMAALLENIDADGFVWPSPYVINTLQDSLIADYTSGAATFQAQNPALDLVQPLTAASASIGVGVAVNTIVFQAANAAKTTAVLTNIAIAAAEEGSLVGFTTAQTLINLSQAGSGPLVVITMAVSVLVSEAMEVAKVQELINDIGDFNTRMNAPVQIDVIMQGNNELDKVWLYDDLDYIMGAGTGNGFQYHTNDNVYGPAFDLNCVNATTVELGADGSGSLTPAQVAGIVLNVCGDEIEYSLSKTTFTCDDLGSQQVTLTAHNDKLSLNCTTTVTVADHAAPSVTCKNITVPLSPGGSAAIGAGAIFQGGSDNCSNVVVPVDITQPTVYGCSHIGAHTLTLTVDDLHGNTATCQAVVTVVDITAPSVTCKNAIVELNSSGAAWLSASEVFQSGTDICGVVSPQSVSKSLFFCSDLGETLITLTANDGHGNTNTCMATVTVVDNIAPTVNCPANKTVAPTGFNPVSAVVSGLDAALSDNCWAPALAYVRSGATTGSGSGPATGLTFNGGATTVAYTVTDGAGQTSTCVFTVRVGNGSIYWENNPTLGVGNAGVALSGDQTATTTSLADGTYAFAFGSGSSFTITPTKTINKFNGVTAADASRIQQHVANVHLITNPYKLVAADVNKSNSVSSLDASVITQALLGNPAALAQFKTSWRFVPVAHAMSNPPWGFPESITLHEVNGEVSGQDFYGIKTGDVTATSANPANVGDPTGSELLLKVQDQQLEAGSEVTVEFSAGQMADLAAFQFTLHFDPEQLQWTETVPSSALPLTTDHFGLYNISEGEIRVAWSQAVGVSLDEGVAVFRLKFNVLESGGKLSEALHLIEDVLPGRAYTSTLAESGVALHFNGTTTGIHSTLPESGLELLQNRPNPFSGTTTIGFVLPEACEAQLRVFDLSGRMLAERKGQYPAGQHEEAFDLKFALGVMYYELTTPFGVLTKKMIRTK